MDPELRAKLDELEKKVDAAYKAAHRTERYMFWTGVISALIFVLPLVGLLFVVPQFVSQYANLSNITATPGTSATTTGAAEYLNQLNSLLR